MELSRKLLIGFSITLLVILLLIAYFYFGSFPIRDTNIDNYLQGHGVFDVKAQSILPEKEAFSRAETVVYEYARFPLWSIWASQGAILELFYDDATYEQEKDRLNTAYTYCEDGTIRLGFYNVYSESTNTPNFSIGGYHFRVVDWSGYPEYDDRYLGLIAYNDNAQSICYLFMQNDLTEASTSSIDHQITHLPLRVPWKEDSKN